MSLWILVAAAALALSALVVFRVKFSMKRMAERHLSTLEAFALAIEVRGDATEFHLRRLQVYSMEIGRRMGLSREELSALRTAAILHDIGKLAVPGHIFSKPARLTPEEFEKVQIHPAVGAQILEQAGFPAAVCGIVRAHHEKWDGTGYPDKLAGEDIPIGARIIAAVDSLDALASARPHRGALPLPQALELVGAESGRAFDPQVVKILLGKAADLEQCTAADAPAQPAVPPAAGFLERIAAARHEAQRLYELTRDLGNSLRVPDTLSLFCSRIQDLVPYDAVSVSLAEGGLLKPCFVSGESSRLLASLETPLGQGLSGWVAAHQQPIVNGDPAVEAARLTSLRSALIVPLRDGENLVGVLALYSLERNAFRRDHLRLLETVSGKLGMALANAVAHRNVQQSAATDGLTGLPNARSLFVHLDRELARCGRSGNGLSVLVCDLDGFKQVNDRHGHLAGNEVLRLLAGRIKTECRDYDCVARMGGDEFVLVLPDYPHGNISEKIESLSRIAAEVGSEVCGEGLLQLSAGCASFPEDGRDADQLLATADQRMYREKRSKDS
ncbi:MAG: diguanylate cyclase [Acidimicrobiia bacterium]|nr:diguanylate cyclase [Acidimicrobiia bacterium]